MRKLYRRLGLAGAAMAAGAALVMQACASQRSMDQSVDRSRRVQAGTPGQTMHFGNFEPIGGPQDSARLSVSGNVATISPDAIVNYPLDWPARASVRGNAAAKIPQPYGWYGLSSGPTAQALHENPAPTVPNVATRPEIILRPGEELWVIQRTHPRVVAASDDTPGCGSLMTRREESGGWREVPVPLAHTSVNARIDGYISSVHVTQKFSNPFDTKIEAVYVFPLPEDAAVNDFLMTVGTRTIRGVIREREEAEKIYERARRSGHVASLMTQDRPNIFTQTVANIEPGKQIDIDITYLHCLGYRDGAFEFVFPMVIGPRFNPPSATREGNGVGAVAYGAPGASGQQTEVQYLRPQQRSATEVDLAVDIHAGVSIESLESPSHAITVEHDRAAPTLAKVKLASSETIPNKDFILRYRIAGSATKCAMLTQPDSRGGQAGGKPGGFFSMLLVPPSDLSYVPRGPVEVVFLIDCSGSMEGEPLQQAKAAAMHALARLDVDDTFQIINFSDAASQLGDQPLPASRRNLDRGLAYLNTLSAGGGTMMMNGVKAALGYRNDPTRTRFVCFLTDGFIGNDAEVLGLVREKLGASRIMSVGIGSAPNRYLLEGLARLGRGAAAFLSPGDKPEEVMDLFLDRIAHAAMTDLSIDWAGLDVSDVYPKRLPDLYVGRPVLLTGRYRGTATGPIKVSGRAGRERLATTVPMMGDEAGENRSTIASIWARKKIEELSDKATSEDGPRVQTAIKQTALDYGLMSSYTAFIAVDSLAKTSGTFGTTVPVPVPVPAGTRYETTVTETGYRR